MTDPFRPGLISVIIPTYNRAGMLTEALKSVAAQTYRPIEIVLVDDGSIDGTEENVEQFQEKFCRAGLQMNFFQRPHQGASPARCFALEACEGEFIQFLDSDDVLHPNKFQLQMAALQDPAIDFVWSPSIKFLDTPDWSATPFVGTERNVSNGIELIIAFINKSCWRTESGLYRRKTCQHTGPWRKMDMFQDWEYHIRMLSWFPRIRFVPGSLAAARQHDSGRIGDRWANGTGLGGALEAVMLAAEISRGSCAQASSWRTAVRGRYEEIAAQAELCAYPEEYYCARQALFEFNSSF